MTTICYSGVGALEGYNHTKKQFLKVMNETSKEECSKYVKSLKCKACKARRRLTLKENKKLVVALRQNLPYSTAEKIQAKLDIYTGLCDRCSKNKKKCTLKQYKQYSGALSGKCPSH